MSNIAVDDSSLMCYGQECVHITRLRAVMVEPSTTQQKIIAQQLESQGIIDILIFEDGESSFDYMQQSAPDLVVSAMYLPDMSGTDLIHRMRTVTSLEAVAFLLISSETDVRALEPIRQAGAIGILPKPFSVTDLQRALCATVDMCFAGESATPLADEVCDFKVLVVDDSQFSRKHICRVLHSLGLTNVETAVDGKGAVGLMKEGSYNLVVTDYNMPEMDGKDLVDYIRNQSVQPDVPIMMITSEQDSERLTMIEQAGVSAICDKPFEPRAIRNLIQRLLTA